MRRAHLRRLALEGLELRTLMATIPAPVVTGTSQASAQINGINVQNVPAMPNDSSPTVVVDPAEPLKMVATWEFRYIIPGANPPTQFTVEAAYSNDGGLNWSGLNTPGTSSYVPGMGAKPIFFTNTDSPSAAFDLKGNVYLLEEQHNSDYSDGAIFLTTYNFSGGAPTPQGGTVQLVRTAGFNPNDPGSSWNQSYLPTGAMSYQFPGAIDVTLAVDANPSTYTDPQTPQTQVDAGSGNIYIAYTRDTPAPPGAVNWNPYTIDAMGSSNGGATFVDTEIQGDNGLPATFGTPKLAVSQAAFSGGKQTVPGGQVTVIYDDFGSLKNNAPPLTAIYSQVLQPTQGGGFTFGAFSLVAYTEIMGAQTDGNGAATYPTVASPATAKGIGPGYSIAADNTLGAFSPHQGRIYVTYVDRYNYVRGDVPDAFATTALNTEVFLKFSDDGGATWQFAQTFTNPSNPNDFLTGQRLPVNNDDGAVDGFSGQVTIADIDAGRSADTVTGSLTGPTHFQPSVAVDQTTGAVVVSYLDTRYDPTNQRIATEVQSSIDGGATFSAASFGNAPNIALNGTPAVDPTTDQEKTVVTLGPIPDNQSSSNPHVEGDLGYGKNQGVAVAGGKIVAVWAGNLNTGNGSAQDFNGLGEGGSAAVGMLNLEVFAATAQIAAGPRIISSTMGPVHAVTAINGMVFNNTTASDGTPQVSGFTVTFDRPVDPATFTANLVTVTYLGAYTGATPVNIPVTSKPTPLDGGPFGATSFFVKLDQAQSGVGTYSYSIAATNNGSGGVRDRIRRATAAGVPTSPGNLMDQNANGTQGEASDNYSDPRPISGNPGQAPYDPLTLPLIVPGPSIVKTTVPGQTATKDQFGNVEQGLVLNQTVSSIDVTFDRDMRPNTISGADVLKILGPAGPITGAQTIQANAASNAVGVGSMITAGQTLSSTLTVPSTGGTFKLARLGVQFSINAPVDSNITVALVGPNGARVTLFSGVGGTGSNFLNTVLDDSASVPISSGSAPFAGTYATPAGALSAFVGQLLDGPTGQGATWTLQVTNNSSSGGAPVATLVNWSLLATPVITVAADPGSDPADNPHPATPRTYKISFPRQSLNGTYAVTLDANEQSVTSTPAGGSGATGDKVDANKNAGLDLLRKVGATTVPVVVNSPPLSLTIPAGTPTSPGTLVSTITVPAGTNFPIQSLILNNLNIIFPNDTTLSATLTGPDGTVVQLFNKPGNVPGNKANFTSTVFDDAAITPIQANNASAPFLGRFRVADPGGLAKLANKPSPGVYKLTITNAGASTGTLTGWGLTLQQAVPATGLGEAVADQETESFRLFTLDPTNPLSTSTWTAVGPASTADAVNAFNGQANGTPPPTAGGTNGTETGSAGPVTAIAVDPSDPTGNTVYIGAAAGGVWKTTDFNTSDPKGPTWLALTTFGPNHSEYIGSIAIYPRNNDPNQSVILVGTGNPNDTGAGASASNGSTAGTAGVTTFGVGFLLSTDGGSTWSLLDSTNNLNDAAGANLSSGISPIAAASRNHAFVGDETYRVVIDPQPRTDGELIFYAAMGGPNGGLYKSITTGKTWTLLKAGQATDVALDPLSGPVDAVTNPTGNLQTIYAAFSGDYIYRSTNQGNVFNALTGGVGDPLISRQGVLSIPFGVGTNPVAGGPGTGRVTLAKVGLLTDGSASDAELNQLYQGWLYALVANPDGTVNGLYLTKDFGQNWTKISTPDLPNQALGNFTPAIPTNNQTQPQIDAGSHYPAGQEGPTLGTTPSTSLNGGANQALSLAIDPSNPNITYVGGSLTGPDGVYGQQATALYRVDATAVADPYAFYISQNGNDGAVRNAGTQVGTANSPNQAAPDPSAFGPPPPPPYDIARDPHLNLYRDPANPFNTNSTVQVTFNSKSTSNNGSGATWTPLTDYLAQPGQAAGGPRDLLGNSQLVFQLVTVRDATTGRTRLIAGDVNGVYTGVDAGDGTLIRSIGDVSDLSTVASQALLNYGQATFLNPNQAQFVAGDTPVAFGDRNGNLQIAELYATASQPSQIAANIAGALFYAGSSGTGSPKSDPNILTDGNLTWTGDLGGFLYGGGVATDQTGTGTFYIFEQPRTAGVENGYGQGENNISPADVDTNFFRIGYSTLPTNVAQPGPQNTIGRTSGLLQGTQDNPQNGASQWYYTYSGNFAVNPLAGANASVNASPAPTGVPVGQVLIGSTTGQVFGTADAGRNWSLVAASSALDGTIAQALAYGAPDPSSPDGGLATNNFLYAGTVGGKVFATTTGGGSTATQWVNISQGLDGSAIQQLVTNPTRGSGAVYAVTEKGVYFLADSRVRNAQGTFSGRWVNITSNLAAITTDPFNSPALREPALAGNSSTLPAADLRLTSVQADFRYAIPLTTTVNGVVTPTGQTAPVLYVGGEGGVFRSIDGGATWTAFPNSTLNGSGRDGGYLPTAQVTSLSLVLGNVNPTTGRPTDVPPNATNPATGLPYTSADAAPDILMASTFGRGDYAIRLAPLVFPASLMLSPATTLVNGVPTESSASPTVTGSSQQTAYGYVTTIKLYDLTGVNLNDPVAVAAQLTPAHLISSGTDTTDAFGNFTVPVSTPYTSNGPKVIGVQAVDASGTIGNLAIINFTLKVAGGGVTVAPPPVSLSLLQADITGNSGGSLYTNIRNPVVTGGGTSPGAGIRLVLIAPGYNPVTNPYVIAQGTADVGGNYQFQLPALGDGTYTFEAAAYLPNAAAPGTYLFSAYSAPLTFTIKTSKPAPLAQPRILASDDTGVKGDGVTDVRRPHLVGTTLPMTVVELDKATPLPGGGYSYAAQATVTADASGNYSLQLPQNLVNGSILLAVRGHDVAGNLSDPSPILDLQIVTTYGDYLGAGKASIAVYQPNVAYLSILNTPGATPAFVSFPLGAVGDIPIQGDFDGSGKVDPGFYRDSNHTFYVNRPSGFIALQFPGGQAGDIPVPGDYDGSHIDSFAVYRPSNATWYILRASTGQLQTIQFGVPDVSRPIPAAWSGHGRTDLGVYDPTTSTFNAYYMDGSGGFQKQFGAPGDRAIVAEFSGHDRADVAVYDPRTSTFYAYYLDGSGGLAMQFGIPGRDIPVPADYEGNGRDSVAVFDPVTSTFDAVFLDGSGGLHQQFGTPNVETPVIPSYGYRTVAGPTTGAVGTGFGYSAPGSGTFNSIAFDPGTTTITTTATAAPAASASGGPVVAPTANSVTVAQASGTTPPASAPQPTRRRPAQAAHPKAHHAPAASGQPGSHHAAAVSAHPKGPRASTSAKPAKPAKPAAAGRRAR